MKKHHMTDEPQEQIILQLLILQATLSRRCILEKKLNTKNVLLAPLKNSTAGGRGARTTFCPQGVLKSTESASSL